MNVQNAAWQSRPDLVELDTYTHSMNQHAIPANVSRTRGLTGWGMYGILFLLGWMIYLLR